MWWKATQKNIHILGKVKNSSHGELTVTAKNSSFVNIAISFLDIINIYLKMRSSINAARKINQNKTCNS